LRERGIGIQTVADEVRSLFPDLPVTLFDHTAARTYKKALFLRDSFYSRKGSVLLGTHMALPYLTSGVDHSVVINMDALYATPTWRLEEDNLATLLTLREITTDTVHVQVRTEETDLLNHARHATVEQFYTEALELRRALSYPPDTLFIHLAWRGGTPESDALRTALLTDLAAYQPEHYTSPPHPTGAVIHYLLLRFPRRDWPHEPLVARLRSLPPAVRLMFNPDRIV
jgi:primosomal protein N'